VPTAKSTGRTRAGRSRAAKNPSLLGEGFTIGVATAGYQIEGGYNGDGEPANNWYAWERSGRVERSGVACDFWAHPEEALDRAASIGCNAFRLSIEWPRLEPESGRFDDAALARYVEILEMCAARGLEPVVTLHHFTHPSWLGEEFWLRPGSPDRFARHVERVLPQLAPHCRRWVTVNEPNIVMLKGWVEGAHPPGRHLAFADALCVLDNLLTAHVLAAEIIVGAQPEAEVTCNTSSSSIYEQDRLLTDLLLLGSTGVPASDIDRYIDERRALHDAAFPPQRAGEFALRRFFAALSPYGTDRGAGGGPLWAQLHATARRPVPRRVVDVVLASLQERTLGAVGFDWYDPVASHALRIPGRRRPPHNRRDWSFRQDLWAVPSRADALRSWCRTEAAFHGGLPLWVVENGMATRMLDHRHVPRADGWDRPHYLRKHFGAIVGAIGDGAPVTVYLHWSLVDNYEWGSYEPRFGIYGMDRSDPSGRVRWLETDAAGDDAAGAFSRVVRGLQAGDRSVLDG
jgi:beta-glucosidase/6-phospho-beta-glucosidase/beta-galactosidase